MTHLRNEFTEKCMPTRKKKRKSTRTRRNNLGEWMGY